MLQRSGNPGVYSDPRQSAHSTHSAGIQATLRGAHLTRFSLAASALSLFLTTTAHWVGEWKLDETSGNDGTDTPYTIAFWV